MFLSEHWPWPIEGICKMFAMQGKNHLVRLQGGLLLVLLVHHLEGDVAGDGGGGGEELGDDGPVNVGRASNHCCWWSVHNWSWMREDFSKKAKSLLLFILTPTFDHSPKVFTSVLIAAVHSAALTHLSTWFFLWYSWANIFKGFAKTKLSTLRSKFYPWL